jgi:hypothetical protein
VSQKRRFTSTRHGSCPLVEPFQPYVPSVALHLSHFSDQRQEAQSQNCRAVEPEYQPCSGLTPSSQHFHDVLRSLTSCTHWPTLAHSYKLVHTRTQAHTRTLIYTRALTHSLSHSCTFTYAHMLIHSQARMHTHTHTHTRIRNLQVTHLPFTSVVAIALCG